MANSSPTATYPAAFVPGEIVFLLDHPPAAVADYDTLHRHILKLLRSEPLLAQAGITIQSEKDPVPPLSHATPSESPATGSLPPQILTFGNARQDNFSLVFVATPYRNPISLLAIINYINAGLLNPGSTSYTASSVRSPSKQSSAGPVLRAAAPNWLAASAEGDPPPDGNHTPTGGPGGRAVPVHQRQVVTLADTELHFVAPALKPVSPLRVKPLPVTVAILDTILPNKQLANHPNPLLQQMFGAKLQDKAALVIHSSPEAAQALAQIQPQIPNPLAGKTIASHGIFIAGLIHSLVPHARIHLIPVLNELGNGSFKTVGLGFLALQKLMLDERMPLIVNCSFMFKMPYFPQQPGDPAIVPERLWSILLMPIRRLYAHLLARSQTLVVAAAGNDGATSPRPAACFPASLDGVIGVGALGSDDQPAPYSNLPDQPTQDGIWTFGGDIAPASIINGIKQPALSDARHGLLGIYLDPLVEPRPNQPLSIVPNPRGWARWAGTSFATPIVAGALARLAAQPDIVGKTSGYKPIATVRSELFAACELRAEGDHYLLVRQGRQD